MFIYTYATIAAVLFTALGAYGLYKKRLFDLNILFGISISSVTVSLAIPLIFGIFMRKSGPSGFGLAMFSALVVYLGSVWILSFLIYRYLARKRPDNTTDNIELSNSDENENLALDTTAGKIILEKAVDTEQNIDKMGLEIVCDINLDNTTKNVDISQNTENSLNLEQSISEDLMEISEQPIDQEDLPEVHAEVQAAVEIDANIAQFVESIDNSLGIDEYIEQAFILKGKGDLESALLYLSYALDKQPPADLVFWIILDICSMYKTLGQIELARDILESYSNSYSDIMDTAVRVEIENNLL